MSGKMNWSRANKLYGRRTLDHRWENDVPDRAAKWLQAVERRQRERRLTTTVSSSAIAVRSSR
jgi:hypothetical protein